MSNRIPETLARALSSGEGNVCLYWAVPDFEHELRREFELRGAGRQLLHSDDQGLWVQGEVLELAWTRARWRDLQYLKIDSIGSAAKELQGKAARWVSSSLQAHRRSQLIQEKLRGYPKNWRDFRQNLMAESWGGFCLLDENAVVFSLDIDPALPLEGPNYIENKLAPSRAYLKLWDAFHRFGIFPQTGDRCFELGASPGGWTHVLRGLGAEVWATDRAELSAELMKDPGVHFQKGDGFRFGPHNLQDMDWVFSDVICYPSKLWDWVQPWLALSQPPQMLCTVKFQGETDFETLLKFAAVPHSRLVHLFQNKHELTWLYQPKS